ncbi:cold shock domain-containing protein [Streptomyces sp. MspMP-M5]|uniref:cold shock domain-containing protein n=1 Tax=unclassified Streptomyces TaxID=2593676 RepID=UPI00039EF9BB|nr:cold shock domain-containing protein [Streptomyces sp. MspMP-M5]MYT29500.1 cold shock domain-containing protein [Streptomyces sp. SID8354]
MLMTGKILRFDEIRGYGFIAPDTGDEDVFMHANDLVDEKNFYQAGYEVEFFMEAGEKGPKASQIRLVNKPVSRQLARGSLAPGTVRTTLAPERRVDDDLCDVLTAADFRSELIETLVAADETLTAAQIQRIRTSLVDIARHHGWVEG